MSLMKNRKAHWHPSPYLLLYMLKVDISNISSPIQLQKEMLSCIHRKTSTHIHIPYSCRNSQGLRSFFSYIFISLSSNGIILYMFH
jgi:hypothetical protein